MAASNSNSFLPYKKGINFAFARRDGITSALDNSFRRTLVSTGGDYAVKAFDTFITVAVAATVTVTLPDLADIRGGQKIVVVVDEGGNAGTFPITIRTTTDDLLGVSSGTITLTQAFEGVMLYSTGKSGGWFVTSRNGFAPSISASLSVKWFGLDPTSLAEAVDRLGAAYEEMHGAVPLITLATTSECLDLTNNNNATGPDHILVPDNSTLSIITGPLTLSAWVRRDNNTDEMTVIHKAGTAYKLRLRGSGASNFVEFSHFGESSLSSSAVLVLDEWVHVVASMTEMSGLGTVTHYRNGLADGSNTFGDTESKDTGESVFLGSNTSSDEFVIGKLDHLSIWNTALTALEVQEIYNNGFPGDLSRTTVRNFLQAWWRMGDNNELVPNDYSTNLNVGVLTGTPPSFTPNDVRLFNHRSILFDASATKFIAFTGANALPSQVTGDMTVSFWMKHDGTGAGNVQVVIYVSDNGTDNLVISMIAGGTFLCYADDGGTNAITSTTSGYADALWHHYVITKNTGSFVKIFRDAGDDTATTGAAGAAVLDISSKFGAQGSGGGEANHLTGANVDEISFWDRKLTATEITELYNSGLVTDLTGHSSYRNLTNWWRMGDHPFDSTGTSPLVNDVRGLKSGTPTTMVAADTELDVSPEVLFSILFASASSEHGTVPDTLASGLSGFSAVTASLWVQRTSVGVTRHAMFDITISTTDSKFLLEFEIGNTIRVGGRSTSGDTLQTMVSAATYAATATWYHVVAIINVGTSSFTLYVDNVLDKTEGIKTFASATFSAAAGTPQTVAATADIANFLNGNIDEFSLWNKELSTAEISELFNGGTPLPVTTHSAFANTIHYWRMGDGDTTPTITDLVGTDNLTLVNTPTFAADTPP